MHADYARIEEDALRLLKTLCRQPSMSAEARALDETAALVDELPCDVGFETLHRRLGELSEMSLEPMPRRVYS